MFQNIADHAIFGQDAMLMYRQNRQAALERLADEMVNQMGRRSTNDQVGSLLVSAVEGNLKAARAPAQVLYNTVEQQTKNLSVSIAEAKAFAKPLAAQARRLKGVQASAAGDPLMDAIAAMPNQMKFGDVKALRSRLISFVDQMSIENKSAPAIGKAKQLIKRLDASMEQTLQASNPDALAMWRDANHIYAKGEAQFNNALVRRLSKMAMDEFGGNPEGVAKTVMQLSPTRMLRVRRAVGEDAWKQFQNVAVQDMLSASRRGDGLVGSLMRRNLEGVRTTSEKGWRTMFSPDELTRLRNFATDLERVQLKQPVGTGSVFIQLKSAQAAGSILAVAGGYMSGQEKTGLGGAGVILFGPKALSYIVLHPTLSKWWIDGMRLPRGSQQGAAIVGRIVSSLPPRYRDDTTAPVSTSGTSTMRPTPQTTTPSAFAMQP